MFPKIRTNKLSNSEIKQLHNRYPADGEQLVMKANDPSKRQHTRISTIDGNNHRGPKN